MAKTNFIIGPAKGMNDHGLCDTCAMAKLSYAETWHYPSIPANHCPQCWYHVIENGRVLNEDSYEYYELNAPKLFSGTKAACEAYVKQQAV